MSTDNFSRTGEGEWDTYILKIGEHSKIDKRFQVQITQCMINRKLPHLDRS